MSNTPSNVDVDVVQNGNANDIVNVRKKYNLFDWKPSKYPDIILTDTEFSKIYDSQARHFRTFNYVNFFVKKLNDLGITCVLVAGRKYNDLSLVFHCKHENCTMSYKVISYLRDRKYTILIDGDLRHDSKVGITRPLNGDLREIAMERLHHIGTKEYAKEMKAKADPNLTANGNLDTMKSKPVYSHMKSKVLGEHDLDKDHIEDLSKMRKEQLHNVQHNVPGAEVYIQHVSSNDFYVHSFSSAQIRILQEMLGRGEEIVLHVDATGTIVAKPQGVEKRVYYYVASIALPHEDKGPNMLFPVSEMVSAAHDAFTIETWLRKFKDEFSRQVGSWTPPAHFVTDFSFAILNAASSGLNNEDLIDYVNRIYEEIVEQKCCNNKKTIISICCNHFMKVVAQDINLNFPEKQASNVVRTFLKETLALMFNVSDLDVLAKIYQNLSEILLSKYTTTAVKEALNFITKIADLEKHKCKDEEQTLVDEDNIELLQFDEIKDDPMYVKSRFFKMFDKLTAEPDYGVKDKSLNNFYCPQYSNLILKKYISILPLWTSIKSKTRKSNSNAESLFNIIKSKLHQEAPIIGHIPLRCSRFLRFTRAMIYTIANDFWDQLPRYRTCNRKRTPQSGSTRQRTKQVLKRERSTSQSPQSIITPNLSPQQTPKSSRPRRLSAFSHSVETTLSPTTPKSSRPRRLSVFSHSVETTLSPTTPKSSRPRRVIELLSQSVLSPKTPKSSKSQEVTLSQRYNEELSTPTTSKSPPASCYIGDPNAKESWGPKRRKLNRKHTYFQSNLLKDFDSPKVSKQIFAVQDKRVATAAKLKNGLVDDPIIYLKPTKSFVVAITTNIILSNSDYKSLQPNQPITPNCINFLLRLYSKKRKDVQILFFETPELVSIKKVSQLQQQNIIGVINHLGEYSLVIINLTTKTLTYVNLKNTYSSENVLQNFLKLLIEHNTNYNTCYDLDGWTQPNIVLPPLSNGDHTDIYMLRFINDLLKRNVISKNQFDVNGFRMSLSHFILLNSSSMKPLCLICGRKEDADVNASTVDWLECEVCKRWCHKKCLASTTFDTEFKCILCY